VVRIPSPYNNRTSISSQHIDHVAIRSDNLITYLQNDERICVLSLLNMTATAIVYIIFEWPRLVAFVAAHLKGVEVNPGETATSLGTITVSDVVHPLSTTIAVDPASFPICHCGLLVAPDVDPE
jgi:hypothetical protein